MNFDINNLVVADFLILIQAAYGLGMFLYIIFAILVVKQVRMMKESLPGILKLPILPIALAHLVVALLIFLVVLFGL